MFEFNHIDSSSFCVRRCFTLLNGILYLWSVGTRCCVLDLWTDFLRSCWYNEGPHHWNWKTFFISKHHLIFGRKCLKIFLQHTFLKWIKCFKFVSSLKSNSFILLIFVLTGYAAKFSELRIAAGAVSIDPVDLPCSRHAKPIFNSRLNFTIYRW